MHNLNLDTFSNNQGGANSDGLTPVVGNQSLVIIELNDSAELIRTNGLTTSQDLNGNCAMVPVVQTYNVAPPYLLLAGTVHTLLIEFTTADPQFHVDGFYQGNLSFT